MNRFPPKRIVVAADLSGPSRFALQAAKVLAHRWRAALDIVHVEYYPFAVMSAGLEEAAMSFPPLSPEAEVLVRKELRKAASGFRRDRLSVRSVPGWPPQTLAELARPDKADLLVLGTHGHAGLDRLAYGSVTEAVIRRARVPVLAVREGRTPVRPARVLAPWNGRSYAVRALRYARELARNMGAELHVFCIIAPGRSIDKECTALRRRLDAILGPGPDWALRVRVGDAREHIIREADSGRYGLIVLSAHRKPFSSDIVLGATVERVLRHARVPVLAVPSGKPPARPKVGRWAGGRIFAA